jgi:hypothetical protein
MIDFARNTPPEVANWLREQLATFERPALRVLATDDRMSSLWVELGNWRSHSLNLVALAAYFTTPTVLSQLQKSPKGRFTLSWPEYLLGVAAEDFVMQLKFWPNVATELWGEPADTLVERLRAFASAAFEKAEKKRRVLDYIPGSSRRGRGDQRQLAFRNALSEALERMFEDDPLPKERQDRIIAILASVLFPEAAVDAETIRRHRQRHRQNKGDN